MKLKIFFCYAHEDELLLKILKTQLRPLQRLGLVFASILMETFSLVVV